MMRCDTVDLTGRVFGRWTVVRFAAERPRRDGAFWMCVCVCGSTAPVSSRGLRRGRSRSCGCLAGSGNAYIQQHGAARNGGTPEYSVWTGMKQRCLNPATKAYKDYGGRGIRIAAEWLDDFPRFLADVGPRPSLRHSLDRIDNDGDYVPGNCRWATLKEQRRNTTRTRRLTIDDETLCVVEWAERTGIPEGTLRSRMRRGLHPLSGVCPGYVQPSGQVPVPGAQPLSVGPEGDAR